MIFFYLESKVVKTLMDWANGGQITKSQMNIRNGKWPKAPKSTRRAQDVEKNATQATHKTQHTRRLLAKHKTA